MTELCLEPEVKIIDGLEAYIASDIYSIISQYQWLKNQ